MRKKNIVVVGGGTGSHTTLSALKSQDWNLTAVVAMTDSGGSSGRLRDDLGHLPPGDLRQCLMALAAGDSEGNRMRRLFDYRFSSGDGLKGHSFGNLLLSALTEVMGSPVSAVEEAARLLRIRGQVLPVTLTNSTLVARLTDGTELLGESSIDLRRDNLDVGIDYIYLTPKAYVHTPVVDAIMEADAIILGPGDIYTSVLPNLLVEDVAEAINESKAIKIHVCNLMTKPTESDCFKASSFVKLILEYLETPEPLDYLIFNESPIPISVLTRYAADQQYPVELDLTECSGLVKNIMSRPLSSDGVHLRHSPRKLARAIGEIFAPTEDFREIQVAQPDPDAVLRQLLKRDNGPTIEAYARWRDGRTESSSRQSAEDAAT